VPDHIITAEWFHTGDPYNEMRSPQQQTTPVRNAKQIEGFTAACKLGRDILDAAHRAIRPGVTTDEIDRVRPGT
jgi:methionyl aminopeptidase